MAEAGLLPDHAVIMLSETGAFRVARATCPVRSSGGRAGAGAYEELSAVSPQASSPARSLAHRPRRLDCSGVVAHHGLDPRIRGSGRSGVPPGGSVRGGRAPDGVQSEPEALTWPITL